MKAEQLEDDDNQAEPQMTKEDEIIEDEEWEKYVKHIQFGNMRQRSRELENQLRDIQYPLRHQHALKQLEYFHQEILPSKSMQSALERVKEIKHKQLKDSSLPSSAVANIVKIKRAFSTILRDLYELLWDSPHEQDLMLIGIQSLNTIQDNAYLFEDYDLFNTVIQILTLLTLKDCTMALLLNSMIFRQFLGLILDIYYFGQTVWNPINQIILTCVCMMATYYEFTSGIRKDLQLIQLVLKCFKYFAQQKQLTQLMKEAENEPEQDEAKIVKKKQNKKDIIDDQPLTPEEKYMQVPPNASELLALAMATFPQSICDMPLGHKYELHINCPKEVHTDIFRQTLSIKVLQALAVDERYRYDSLITVYNIFEQTTKIAKIYEFFTLPREAMRLLTNMLFGFDGMMMWLKFDSLSINNDNSNYLRFKYKNKAQIKKHGNPKKIPMETGLYYDGCGCDFQLGDGLEIIGKTHTFDQLQKLEEGLQLPEQVSICFWMVYFSQKTQKQRNTPTKNQVRTLLGCNDGVTSLILIDPKMILIGVTNVADNVKDMQPIGLKFFKTNLEKSKRIFQGWNHFTVSLDNRACSATLYINGHFEDTITQIQHQMNVKYIGNHKNLEQPFGYLCDLRIYPRIITIADIKLLGQYEKKTRMLYKCAVLEQVWQMKLMGDLRKLIQDTQGSLHETCIATLEVVSLLCFGSTKMRLEAGKQNLFEIAAFMLHHENQLIAHYANQVVLSMR